MYVSLMHIHDESVTSQAQPHVAALNHLVYGSLVMHRVLPVYVFPLLHIYVGGKDVRATNYGAENLIHYSSPTNFTFCKHN